MCSNSYKVLELQNNRKRQEKIFITCKKCFWLAKVFLTEAKRLWFAKKYGLENRTMWPMAITGLVFGMQKYFWAAKDILICKKIRFAKKHFEKAGWLWPLAIDLVSGLQPLLSCRASRSCKTQFEFYLRFKKSKKRQKIQRLSVRIATALIMSLARTSKHLLRRERQRKRRRQQGETQPRDKNAIEMQNI